MEQIKKMGLEEVVLGIPGGFFIYKDCPGEELVYVNQEVAELFGCDTVEGFVPMWAIHFGVWCIRRIFSGWKTA